MHSFQLDAQLIEQRAAGFDQQQDLGFIFYRALPSVDAADAFTHAANRFSTNPRAIRAASSGEAQVLRTTILSVI